MTHGFRTGQPAATLSLLGPGCFPGSGRRLQLIFDGPAGDSEKALLDCQVPVAGPAMGGANRRLGPRPLSPEDQAASESF